MSTITSLRRAGTALAVAAALAVSVAGAGSSAHATAATRSAHAQLIPSSPALVRSSDWLADQLRHGVIHNFQFKFDDYGLTADTAFALNAVGQHGQKVQAARTALSQHVADYTGAKKERFAGPLGKLLVLAESTGGGETDFGGVNLVTRTAARVSTTAPIVGRIEDQSAFGDFANVLGQVFVTRGLLVAGDPAGDSALTFLLQQQCPAGFFRLDFTKSKTAADQSCGAQSASDLDVTALAVIELSDQVGTHPELATPLDNATEWLVEQQKKDGSFRGGTTRSPKNTNSTGLGGTALFVAGRCPKAQAAAQWVRDRQVSNPPKSSPLAGEKGAIAYNDAALKAGKKHGIDKTTRDQWRRAAAQAAPSLVALTCPA
jgi:hypothetical protein